MRALPLVALLLAAAPAAQTDRDDLNAERLELQDAIRAYQADARAYDAAAVRLRADYDRLARYGGSAAERDAYDEALFRLEDDARRLEGEAAMLNDWTADLNARFQHFAYQPPTAYEVELRQRVAERRRADARRAAELLRHRDRAVYRAHMHRTRRHHHH